MAVLDSLWNLAQYAIVAVRDVSSPVLLLYVAIAFAVALGLICLALFIVAPVPRAPYDTEKTYRSILQNGTISGAQQLPCWYDRWKAERALTQDRSQNHNTLISSKRNSDDAEVFISVVIPAYNEKNRLGGMLEEAIDFLQRIYGDAQNTPYTSRLRPRTSTPKRKPDVAKSNQIEKDNQPATTTTATGTSSSRGWEILIVSDGSTDETVSAALDFARDHQSNAKPNPIPGPRTPNPTRSTQIPPESIRVVSLEENRGKGGAVVHGMRHARGRYVLFADADGASNFDDLDLLLRKCTEIEDESGRAIAIGSRAHLVGGEAVVKRSKLRNFLMHSFHLFLRLATPPATSRIKDTQCGFKLFSRPTLPHIIPYMHAEGWIFDVEMLMLAEAAGVPIAEVDIAWTEIGGSKLNVLRDSVAMAWDLAVLRAAWSLGVYSTRP